MALTRSQPTMALSRHEMALHFPQPSAQQLLQREIEDTLMVLSAVPESNDRIWLDLSLGKDGSGRIPIQSNQLALFQRLEELVARLEPEQKERLIGNLHPAMSVREREALKIVLQRGLGGVVPRRLEVKKASSTATLAVDEKDDGRDQTTLATVPPLAEEAQELLFPALTAAEMTTRQRELDLARAEQSGELALTSEQSRRTAAEAKRRREEIAKVFSLAARKLQAMEGLAASGLANPVHSPALREGMQLVRTATSALRAYADVTPREVVRESPGAARPIEVASSFRTGQQLPRSSVDTKQPPPPPGIDEPARSANASEPAVIAPGPPTSPPPPSPPPKASTSSDRPQQRRKFKEPPPVLSTDELRRLQDQAFFEPSVRSSTSAAHNEDPPLIGEPPASTRPRSDPSTSTCPWPDSFFVAPRPAPAPPTGRSVPLPVPRPPPARTAQQRDHNAPAPIHPAGAEMPAAVQPAPLARRRAPDDAATAHAAVANHAIPASPTSSPALLMSRHHGSISAARAGIAARLQREQQAAVRGTLPYARSSLEGKWSGVSLSRREGGDGEGLWEVVGEADGVEGEDGEGVGDAEVRGEEESRRA